MTLIGRVCDLMRYPVKSMAGITTQSAHLGFHGMAGDRRFAFRLAGDGGGFPFLPAGRFPELVTYQPEGVGATIPEPLPTHVRTPSGAQFELRSQELRDEIGRRSGKERPDERDDVRADQDAIDDRHVVPGRRVAKRDHAFSAFPISLTTSCIWSCVSSGKTGIASVPAAAVSECG